MTLILQCLAACIVFTAIMIPTLLKDPLLYIMSYPTTIRKKVESLPQYASVIQKKEQKHFARKVASVFVIAILFAVAARLSGAKNFVSAATHVFILFMSVNLFDLFVLDFGWFCHSLKVRIPGTEDMDAEYRSLCHHIRGAVIGTGLCAFTAALSGGMVHFLSLFLL